jgi:hypothetical protein
MPEFHRSSGRSRFLKWLGGRELLAGGAAFGLVVGLGWVGEARVCEAFQGDPAAVAARDAALVDYAATRCEAGHCESLELVSHTGCRAKVRVLEQRFDASGDKIGLFRADEGLEFSPMLERWRLRETLEVKQILGLPGY